MGHRDIRAMLRGATRDRVIDGWYFYGDEPVRPIQYVVSLPTTGSQTFSTPGAIGYCSMLASAGVEPLYVS